MSDIISCNCDSAYHH